MRQRSTVGKLLRAFGTEGAGFSAVDGVSSSDPGLALRRLVLVIVRPSPQYTDHPRIAGYSFISDIPVVFQVSVAR